ncbi:MAG TPA: YCF48-related protein [Bacteroidota bacterium]|nr:YCF48-related protein [Bacteroidota bacterium]
MKVKAMPRFVLCGVFLLSASSLFAQWNWQSPLPQGNALLHVQFIDTSLGWAVGDYGTILHTSTGGSSWYEQEYARTDNILSISMTSSSEGWAVGDNGLILHTTDSGDDWLEQTSTITSGLNAVVFVDTLNGWAAGDNEVILHTTNGGTTWVVQHQNPNPTTVLNAIAFTSPGEGWAVGANRKVYHTIDSGAAWQLQPVGSGAGSSYLAVAFVGPSIGFIAGTGGETFRTTDGGTVWSSVSAGVSTNLNQIVMQNSFVGWIAGDYGKILRTINGGLSWSALAVGDSEDFNGLTRAGGRLWAVGTLGKIIESTNSGTSWSALDKGSRLSANWIDFPSGSVGVAVGQSGLILRTTDAGTTWLGQSSPSPSVSCYGVSFIDANHGWAVGDNGTIIRTVDGLNWTTQPSTVAHSLFGITFGSSSSGWIVGGEGTGFTGVILNSTDAGASWQVQYNSVPQILYGASFPDATSGWVVGEHGLILHTTNAGTAWATQPAGTTAALFWCSFVDNNRGWAVGDSGRILHTTDGGSSWKRQNSGVSVSLFSISHVSSAEAFITGDAGTILHTSDAGSHWEVQYSRTLKSIFGIFSPGGGSVWACGDYGTILENTLPFIGGSITGLVSYDVNNNGIHDAGEPGIGGWIVKLQGMRTDSALTINNGSFAFQNVPYGAYTVKEIVQPSWTQTSPALPGLYSFTLSADTPSFSAYFGNYAPRVNASALNGGWNILSLPLLAADLRKTSLYPNAISAAFSYSGSYVVLDTLGTGIGYWLKVPSAESVWIAGIPFNRDTVELRPDWNMVGCISDSVSVGSVTTIPAGIIASHFFAYNRGYATVNMLTPGKGYWLKSSQSGKLVLEHTSSVSAKSETAERLDGPALESMSSMTIADRQGHQQTLYFGIGDLNSSLVQGRALPPLPPAGGFDARFQGDRDLVLFSARERSASARILLQTAGSPMTLSWYLRNEVGIRYVLSDRNSANLFLLVRADSGTITLPNSDSRSLLLSVTSSSDPSGFPTEFALFQNMPNPFNPTTRIRLSLPRAAFVSLKVFDLLGREVATLISAMRQPGVYEAEWNASNVPTGVYLYRLVAGDFSDVKKMLIVR